MRMQIHGNCQSPVLQITEKLTIIRKQCFIKSITGPSFSPELAVGCCILRDIFNQMPIHIYGRNRQWNLFVRKLIHQIDIFLLTISIITGPPVTQRVFWQQRRKSGQFIEFPQTTQIILAKRKDIKIRYTLLTRR